MSTALERGDLDDWARLAVQIRRQPWGRTARQVEEVLTHLRPYGVADLMETVIGEARAAAEESDRAAVAAELRSLVSRSGLSQNEFARHLGTSPSRLSTYLRGRVVPSAALLVRARRVGEVCGRKPPQRP
ncbi:MAG: helix-turn-helix domain-containing protein [Actinomycetota bacterium]|nr:helix-turn-helix domain-containing protein [Actinomycetota bacterium]